MATNDELLYNERLTSKWTETLFIALTLLSLMLFIWRVTAGGLGGFAVVFLCLAVLFLFYSVNYRVLTIHLTAESLKLRFGIFTWAVPLENVESCLLDENLPMLMKYGGAGIHFMMIHKRYRASFNFLEYPRVVIVFKKKAGPVQDISFTTRRPDDVIRLVQEAVTANQAA
jgi:hypothetical protein